jgi:glycosyltransferase involved in cell wall biosynthesis
MNIAYLANVRMPTEKAHGVQIMKMCEAFAARGDSVELVVPTRKTPISEDPFAYYNTKRTFSIVRVPAFDTVRFGKLGFLLETLTFAVAALRYVHSHPSDLIFSRDEMVLYLISFFKRNIIWESHDGRLNFATRRLFRVADRVVVTTAGMRKAYIAHGLNPHKVILARNGVDLESMRCDDGEVSRLRAALASPGEFIALYAGRLDGWKGAETLLAAADSLPPNVRVVIVGGEPDQIAVLREKFPRVTFVGFVPYRMIGCYQRAADILILPNTGKDAISVNNTSPLKLFTYMTAEKPIIASDLPSIREIVGDDACYFVPADNPGALARGIIAVASDSEGARSRARRAREMVEVYTWNARARAILSPR